MLVNVIKNALEAMPDGGTLSITSCTVNGMVHLSVTDTGGGISEENLQRLFQPFFTTKGLQSSGLGLSSSYGIIKKHHGEMTVKSAPGQGTTFTIILPRASAQAKTEKNLQPVCPDLEQTKIKFLIIDDEKNILKMMALYFEDTCVELTTANTAEKGLQEICGENYDVVLCDLSMDGMNGLQLGKAAKDHADRTARLKIPFLLYTGLNEKLDPDELSRCGVDGVVRKPVPCSELQRIIQETASKFRRGEFA